MIVYKLTDQKKQTHGGCQWEIGAPRETDGSGDLCGPGWLHYYHDSLLAVLLNPIHADIEDPILWEAEAEGAHKDDKGLKGGCTRLTLLRQIDLPQITTEQRIRFGILCAKAVCAEPVWNAWAEGVLSSGDRSEAAEAWAAEAWADAAADARAWAAAAAEAWAAAAAAARAAADAAADAAWMAADAADAEAAWAADAAADAAWAAERVAAAAAARAAAAAAGKDAHLDLIAIAREALKGQTND